MEWLFKFAFKLPVNHHFLRNQKIAAHQGGGAYTNHTTLRD
jgi:hypothetical protein